MSRYQDWERASLSRKRSQFSNAWVLRYSTTPAEKQEYEEAVQPGKEPFNTLIIGSNLDLWLSIFTQVENSAAKYIDPRAYYPDLRSDALYEHIKATLLECQSRHNHCLKKFDRLLPKRILDVNATVSGGSSEMDLISDKIIRLVTTPRGERGEYVALSYCWGEEQPHKTTQCCLPDYERSIDLSTLPQTIRDAVFVTRRYLWMDSMCIIQNNSSDKVVEISNMGSIYMNATLTIGAVTAKTASGGFLGSRMHIRCLRMPFVCYDGTPGEVHAIEIAGPIDPPPHQVMGPLNERGWALQERILSQRFLTFDMRHIGYKCRSNSYTALLEDFNLQFRDLTHFPTSVFRTEGSTDLQVSKPMEMTPTALASITHLEFFHRSKLWTEFVTEYSRTKLSSWRDQYDAIGGLVKVLSDAWGYEYLAGLWKEDLSAELLWFRKGSRSQTKWDDNTSFSFSFQSDNKSAQMSSDYCFSPSWSWLSVVGEVGFDAGSVGFESNLRTWHIDYVKCEIEPLSADLPYGEVKRAELTVRASAITAVEALKIFRKGSCEVAMDDGSDHLSEVQKNGAIFILGGHNSSVILTLILFPCGTHAIQRIGILEFLPENGSLTDVAEAFGHELIEDEESAGSMRLRCIRE
ncbi:hypothetical protein VTL71DRAFT_11458 [Oculimacula yallundae]|uniref:Heterokaryon incompatibility domain-containing protein n=1 Tax=Oculimacula yallundae TaxID=86028 RepID=A0ABR4CQJ3_9HELO